MTQFDKKIQIIEHWVTEIILGALSAKVTSTTTLARFHTLTVLPVVGKANKNWKFYML